MVLMAYVLPVTAPFPLPPLIRMMWRPLCPVRRPKRRWPSFTGRRRAPRSP
jgi:hypothetical protein